MAQPRFPKFILPETYERNMSRNPILFLLKNSFLDPKAGQQEFYCPFCVSIEGMLAVFPQLRDELDIRYVDFAKPRGDLPKFVGDKNQSCPQLVLCDGDDDVSGAWSVEALNGARRIKDTTAIQDYLSQRFGLPHRHP